MSNPMYLFHTFPGMWLFINLMTFILKSTRHQCSKTLWSLVITSHSQPPPYQLLPYHLVPIYLSKYANPTNQFDPFSNSNSSLHSPGGEAHGWTPVSPCTHLVGRLTGEHPWALFLPAEGLATLSDLRSNLFDRFQNLSSSSEHQHSNFSKHFVSPEAHPPSSSFQYLRSPAAIHLNTQH